jgi:hypothetical protein
MRENSPIGRVAFWLVTVLAVLWVVCGVGALAFGVIEEPGLIWPALVVLVPVVLVAAAVILDRLRSAEDSHYSRDVHE